MDNQTTSFSDIRREVPVDADDTVVSIQCVRETEPFLSCADPGGARLIELARLDHAWDGEGASTIDHAALAMVRDLLRAIDGEGLAAPRVYPTEGGGVQLEWHAPGRHTEVEIFADLRVESFHLGAAGQRHEDSQGLDQVLSFLRGIEL